MIKTLRNCPLTCLYNLCITAASGPGGVKKKLNIEVETDAEVLCSRLVGGNIYKEGEDPVLGPDEDYPDWLWNLHIDRQAIPLEELSEDDPKYWRKLKTMNMKVNNRHRAAKKGF